jgi:Ribbon-helix-helix protein, copG family
MEQLSTISDVNVPRARARVRRQGKMFVSILMDRSLVARLEAAARGAKVSRSWLVREVLSGWLAEAGHD